MKNFLILSAMLVASSLTSTSAQEGVHAWEEKSIYLPTNVRLSYVEQGNNDGIPVILLHGFTDSWHSFEKVLPHLPASLHVFAISQRGHGNSEQTTGSYTTAVFSNDLAAFIKKLKLAPVIIVGHSMGGIVAQQFAIDHSAMIKGLTIVSSDAAFVSNPGMPELLQTIQQFTDPVNEDFVKGFQLSTVNQPIDTLYFQTLLKESLKLPARVWKAVSQGIMNTNLEPRLISIRVPTLIFWGAKDGFCLRSDQDILTKGIANSSLRIFENAGHALHWEEPKRFADELHEFIQGITEKN